MTGYKGLAESVFDVDSVGLLQLFADMNEGLHDERKPDVRLDRTDFLLGCVVTNHKRYEREVVPQYLKLRKKVRAGARFVINQIGWNVRKDDELLRWIRREQLPVSILANVYLLSAPPHGRSTAARSPGSWSPTSSSRSPSATAAARTRAARSSPSSPSKHVAVARGLGFNGVYLGGHMPAERFEAIVELADSYGPDDWRQFAGELQYPAPGEFYFFEPDPETGLSSDEVSRSYLESQAPAANGSRGAAVLPFQPARARRRVRSRSAAGAGRQTALRGGRERLAAAAQGGPHRSSRPPSSRSSAAATVAIARCPRSLTSAPNRCARRTSATGRAAAPATGCARCTTPNASGPQAYERLKAYGEEAEMLDGPVVIKDNSLAGTSAWANALLGRDHHGDDPRH